VSCHWNWKSTAAWATVVSVDLEKKTLTIKDENGEEKTAPVLDKAHADLKAKHYGNTNWSELVIDEPQRQAMVRGAAVALTPTEWGVLTALATVPGRVYSRFELINRVRGYEFEGYERTVDSHVKNLRRKVEEDPGNPRIVQTVLGGGYRLGLARDD